MLTLVYVNGLEHDLSLHHKKINELYEMQFGESLNLKHSFKQVDQHRKNPESCLMLLSTTLVSFQHPFFR